MKVILLIVVPIALIFACALAISLIPLPHPLGQRRDLIAAVAVGALGLLYVAGLTVYLVSSFLGRSRAIDPAFVQIGLDARPYALFGRQYHGSFQGRQVDATFVPAARYRPDSLEISLAASVRSHLAVAETRPLLSCAGCQRLDPGDAALAHLQVLALDSAWASRLLADPEARDALTRLAAGGREVYLQPGRALLRAKPRDLAAQDIRRWLDDLLALAERTESLAAGAPSAEELGSPPAASPRGDLVTPAVVALLLISALPVLLLCLGAVLYGLLKGGR